MQAATGPGGVKVRKRDKADIFQDLVSAERGILAPLLHVTRIMKNVVQRDQRRLIVLENINPPDDLDFFWLLKSMFLVSNHHLDVVK